MVKRFLLDTNCVMNMTSCIEDENEYFICETTLDELESIKSLRSYDDERKFKARRAVDLILDNEDKIKVIKDAPIDMVQSDKPDDIICYTSIWYNMILVTNDKIMYLRAKNIFGIEAKPLELDCDKYKGFKRVSLHDFSFNRIPVLKFGEYLIVEADDDYICYVCVDDKTQEIEPINMDLSFYSPLYNRIEARDETQVIAMDALQRTQVTMLKGKAGTGKSLLALSYLFQELNRSHIDKIYMFVNPVKTYDSQELGYYSGSRDEKLLQGQAGNFLSSHLGAMEEVERLIASEELIILPFSDIRGIDLSQPVGLYITEAQNTSIPLMKLALTRAGEECKVIIDGDYETQVDRKSFSGQNNGMRRMSEVFRGSDIYSEVELEYVQRSKIAEIADRM